MEKHKQWTGTFRKGKESGGMLLSIMSDAKVLPSKTLMVGDMESDRQAAEAADCDYLDIQAFLSKDVELLAVI